MSAVRELAAGGQACLAGRQRWQLLHRHRPGWTTHDCCPTADQKFQSTHRGKNESTHYAKNESTQAGKKC
eukprot:COSAG01_NODE_63636_length_279_cov_0.811111_1_plen_69_part_10